MHETTNRCSTRTLRPSTRVVPTVPMPRRQRIDCPHERRHRVILRLIAWTLSIAVVAIVGAAGVNAATRRQTPTSTPRVATRHQAANPVATPRDSAPLTLATTSIQLQGAPAPATATT